MLEQTAGRKLSEARLAKGLSLDAAAHAMKMRPDKILALENDDFTRFGGSAYAKGFLLLYGRYLKVDVSAEMQDLKAEDGVISLHEYQYLNNAPPPKVQEHQPLHRRQPKAPSIVPLLAFVVLAAVALGGLRLWGYAHQLGLDRPAGSPLVENVAPRPEAGGMVAEPAPAVTSAPAQEAVPAAETPVPAPEAVAETAAPENELSVEPLKKTYVTIRNGKDRNAPVRFEDYVYPQGGLLKVAGTTFFVEVRDGTAVQIRKNGQPVAYQSPGIVVE